MSKQKLSRAIVGVSAISLALSLGDCTSEQICGQNPEHASCRLDVSLLDTSPPRRSGSLRILPQEESTKVTLRIVRRRDDQHDARFPVWLVDVAHPEKIVKIGDAGYVSEHPDGGGQFELSVGKSAPPFAPVGRYQLRVGAPGSDTIPDATASPSPEITVVKRTIAYQPPVVLAQTGQTRYDYPTVNQLGFVGNELIAVAGGTDGLTAKQLLKRYQWNASSLLEVPLSIFWRTPWELDMRAGFGTAQEFLFHMPKLVPPSLRCLTKASNPGECVSVDPPFPGDSQTLAVSADGKWGAYAANDGALWSRDLSASGTWQALVTTKAPTAKQVLGVWLVDVSGDGKTDVVGVWQEGPAMEARVFLGNGNTFAEDAKWTQAVTGIGPSALSAMAMGDVDGDGYADVVVATGLTVTVQQNLFGTFAPAWKAELDVKQAGTKVSALAVGRVSGTDPKQSLDIVAASYTDYDATGKCSLYLHVFRPQPPTAQ